MPPPAPSAVMDSIVSVLSTKLGSQVVEVRTHDTEFGEDGTLKDLVTVPDPAVLVCCLRAPVETRDYGPPVANAVFVALCLARVPSMTAQDTPGDVAMDLAFLVAGIVDGEFWESKAVKRAQRITPANENALKTRLKGVSVWSVTWQQQIELQTSLTDPVYNDLRRIRFTEKAGGGSQTPVTEAQLTESELQGAP